MTRACAAMIAVASLVGTIACTQPAPPPAVETPVDTAADVAAVTAIGEGWFDAFNAGDVEKLVSLYTDDARISRRTPPSSLARRLSARISLLTRLRPKQRDRRPSMARRVPKCPVTSAITAVCTPLPTRLAPRWKAAAISPRSRKSTGAG